MQLVDQWRVIEENLPTDWDDVRLLLTTEEAGDRTRAAQVLGSMGAGHLGDAFVLQVLRAGGQQGPEAARRLFGRLDQQRIWCRLERSAVHADEPATVETPEARLPLSEQWGELLDTLPDRWGSLLCELEIDSSDLLPRVALLCAPLNPTRVRGRRAFSFRVARLAGYGASTGMTGRCLERLGDEQIDGRVAITTLFPETDNVATQGPVFMVGGRPL